MPEQCQDALLASSWKELVKPAADRLALIGYIPDGYIILDQTQAAAVATMLRSMAKQLDTYEGR